MRVSLDWNEHIYLVSFFIKLFLLNQKAPNFFDKQFWEIFEFCQKWRNRIKELAHCLFVQLHIKDLKSMIFIGFLPSKKFLAEFCPIKTSEDLNLYHFLAICKIFLHLSFFQMSTKAVNFKTFSQMRSFSTLLIMVFGYLLFPFPCFFFVFFFFKGSGIFVTPYSYLICLESLP